MAVVAIIEGGSIFWACDSNYGPRTSERSKWVKKERVIIASEDTKLIHVIESFPFTGDVIYEGVVSYMLEVLKLTDFDVFLIGGNGNLFRVEPNKVMQIEFYDALGMDSEIAMGALFAVSDTEPRKRSDIALRACIRWGKSCGKIKYERI